MPKIGFNAAKKAKRPQIFEWTIPAGKQYQMQQIVENALSRIALT